MGWGVADRSRAYSRSFTSTPQPPECAPVYGSTACRSMRSESDSGDTGRRLPAGHATGRTASPWKHRTSLDEVSLTAGIGARLRQCLGTTAAHPGRRARLRRHPKDSPSGWTTPRSRSSARRPTDPAGGVRVRQAPTEHHQGHQRLRRSRTDRCGYVSPDLELGGALCGGGDADKPMAGGFQGVQASGRRRVHAGSIPTAGGGGGWR
jgi:hypothetical protein